MYPNHEIEERRVTVNNPGERVETTVSDRSYHEPQQISLSPGAIIALIFLALVVIGLTYYVVSNNNANDEANRQALLEASQTQPQQSSTQPAAQQPVIIQQPVPQQQAPVIVQQPAASADRNNALDDSTLQDAATKRLSDMPGMATVSVLVVGGRATLLGSVANLESKIEAERIVKSIQGIRSVDNKIDISK